MSSDVLTATSVLELEDGNRLELCYYIQQFDLDNKSVFGLRVDKKELESGKLLETESSPAFAEDYNYILRAAEEFAKGQVTPCVLVEMCEEWDSVNSLA